MRTYGSNWSRRPACLRTNSSEGTPGTDGKWEKSPTLDLSFVDPQSTDGKQEKSPALDLSLLIDRLVMEGTPHELTDASSLKCVQTLNQW